MANALYRECKYLMATGGFDWETANTVNIILVDTGAYTVDLDAHTALANIPAGARIETHVLTNRVATKVANNIVRLNADDVLTDDVSDGAATVEAIVIYDHTADVLWAYIDTVTSGLPLDPNGGPVKLVFDNVLNELFHL